MTGDVLANPSSFQPMEFTVRAGGRVLWANNSNETHTVTPDNAASWQRGTLDNRGATFAVTFNTVGSFPYHCEFHGAPGIGMHGTISVVP